MAEHHRLLERQMRRHLKNVDIESVPGLDRFLSAVGDAYEGLDEDRRLLERAMDISGRELTVAEQELRSVLEALPDEFLLLDRSGKVLEHRPGSHAVLPLEMCPIGDNIRDVICAEGSARFVEALDAVAAGERLVCFEYAPTSGPLDELGQNVICEARVFPLCNGRTVSLIRNISDRKVAERRIAHLAYHDSLTGLPNRLFFHEQIALGIDSARRENTRMGVLFLDVDRFKHINDTFGHAIGDELLVTLSNRLRAALRFGGYSASPAPPVEELRDERTSGTGQRALIARMGGDEFTVLLHDLEDVDAGNAVCRRILEAVSQPIVLQGLEVVTTFSVGLSVFPDHGSNVETLLQNADAAMYHAKATGRANAQVYASEMNNGALAFVQQEAALRHALRAGELHLEYQPVVCMETNATTGLEALIRWNHPEHGPVSPEVFVAVAEESELILELGAYVVEQACAQIRAWLDTGFVPPKVSINLSSRHFWQGDVVRDLARVLDTYRVPAELVGIEMTETAIVRHTERAREAVLGLQELGLRISLDDFGTGYSSLGYLKRFPVDILKIDRSFVNEIALESESATLIRAIVAMGHGLGLQVVAEGVETESQMDFLRELGCDFAQGFRICRPCSADAIRAFVSTERQPHSAGLRAVAS